jgi:hypothetical protein
MQKSTEKKEKSNEVNVFRDPAQILPYTNDSNHNT